MKKPVKILFFILLLVIAFVAWNIFGPVVSAPEKKYFYIKTGASYEEVKKTLVQQKIITGSFFFDKLATKANYHLNIKPGRYEIKNSLNLLSLVRMLKSGNQSPVKLVINKLRTKEDLAGKIGNAFEADSIHVLNFLTSNDSLAAYKLDTNNVMTHVIPNTYLITWNGPFKKIFQRLEKEHDKFWTKERLNKAAALDLSPENVYTMASIVEEETNKNNDKGLIASVYINRIRKGMKLEADPTVKYSMRNFGLKRILHGHLDYQSPYNTYRNTGLPPGPICTPSTNTIEAVLNAPKTDYIFFVAKPDFKGYSNFASTYSEHLLFAKAYQKALDSLIISKKNSR
ncbi:MAG: endolytic transglycosylase MltG [Ferruginibacter sp.]